MNTEELLKLLYLEIDKYSEITNGLYSYSKKRPDPDVPPPQKEDSFDYSFICSNNYFENARHKEDILSAIREVIKSLLPKIYVTSKTDNTYWEYCSFRTYEKTYVKRKEDFLDKYDDKSNDRKKVLDVFKASEIKNIKQSLNSKLIDFFDEDLKNVVINETKKKLAFFGEITNESPYGLGSKNAIFASQKAIDLFDEYFESYIKNSKSQLAESSFIFWQMKKDRLINSVIKSRQFIEFLSDTMELHLNSTDLKTLDNISIETKLANYQAIKKGL